MSKLLNRKYRFGNKRNMKNIIKMEKSRGRRKNTNAIMLNRKP